MSQNPFGSQGIVATTPRASSSLWRLLRLNNWKAAIVGGAVVVGAVVVGRALYDKWRSKKAEDKKREKKERRRKDREYRRAQREEFKRELKAEEGIDNPIVLNSQLQDVPNPIISGSSQSLSTHNSGYGSDRSISSRILNAGSNFISSLPVPQDLSLLPVLPVVNGNVSEGVIEGSENKISRMEQTMDRITGMIQFLFAVAIVLVIAILLMDVRMVALAPMGYLLRNSITIKYPISSAAFAGYLTDSSGRRRKKNRQEGEAEEQIEGDSSSGAHIEIEGTPSISFEEKENKHNNLTVLDMTGDGNTNSYPPEGDEKADSKIVLYPSSSSSSSSFSSPIYSSSSALLSPSNTNGYNSSSGTSRLDRPDSPGDTPTRTRTNLSIVTQASGTPPSPSLQSILKEGKVEDKNKTGKEKWVKWSEDDKRKRKKKKDSLSSHSRESKKKSPRKKKEGTVQEVVNKEEDDGKEEERRRMELIFFSLPPSQDQNPLTVAMEHTLPFPFMLVVEYFWKFAASVNGEKIKFKITNQWANPVTTNVYTIRECKVKNKVPIIFRSLFGSLDHIVCDEHVVFDPNNKTLRIQNINHDFQSFFTIVDQREYRLHPENPNWTLFLQSGTISATAKCNFFQSNVRNFILKSFRKQSEEAYQDFLSYLGNKKS